MSGGSEELKAELTDLIATNMGRPLKPGGLFFVTDLPRTRSAKVMRRVIRNAYLREALGDISGLVNPEAIEEIRQLSS